METKDFNVNKYLSLALEAIDEIHAKGKLPIVVGGTNYYIEGLLFHKATLALDFDLDLFDKTLQQAKIRLPP